MKVECKNCTHFKNEVCAKNSKNGYFNCGKFRAIPIAELIKERNALLLTKDNPRRLAELTQRLSDINGGII